VDAHLEAVPGLGTLTTGPEVLACDQLKGTCAWRRVGGQSNEYELGEPAKTARYATRPPSIRLDKLPALRHGSLSSILTTCGWCA
jgi:hypothetical protein